MTVLTQPGRVALLALLLLGGAAPTAAAPAACRVAGIAQELRCGSLMRPLDPTQPAGRQIELHYLVVPATAAKKLPDPVLFFAGGPGQSAIALAPRVLPLFQRLLNRRDLVFIDQRGTGRSAPLDCEDDDAATLAERLDSARAIARLRDCRRALQALPHGDLRQYTTVIASADVDAVRAALGAPQLNLVGGSYGTRAALDYLRQFPQRVRRVVLDGVAPPDMVLPDSQPLDSAAALAALFEACESEDACRARHPRLAERWPAWLATLPRSVSAIDPASGAPVELTLTREAVASAVRGPLYAPAVAAALPYAIGEALVGRATPLIGLAAGATGGARAAAIAEGQHFSVVCAEDAPRMQPPAAVDELGAALARPYRELCADWPRGTVPPDFYALPESPAPVLAFSGGLDPVTPPRHGERVVQALGPLARHVVVPQAGHGVMGIGCARDLLLRFIDTADAAAALAVDAGCLVRLPRPPAFEPPRPEATR